MHAVKTSRLVRYRGFGRAAVLALIANTTALATNSNAEPSRCAVPDAALATTLFEGWNAALKTQHPDRVTRLFETDGGFLGFASPIARTGYMPIRDYFLYFLQYEPKAQVTERHVETGCNFLVDQGTYVWSLKSRSTGAVETHEARYRFIYELSGGQWRIAQFVDTLAGSEPVPGFAVPAPTSPRVAVINAANGTAVAGYVRRGRDASLVIPSRLNGPTLKPIPAPLDLSVETDAVGTAAAAAKPRARALKKPAVDARPPEIFNFDSTVHGGP